MPSTPSEPVTAARVSPDAVRRRFVERFGAPPRLFHAPGRINIIGEHTDYSGGLAMPAAIDRQCLVAARPNGSGSLTLVARSIGAEARVDLRALAPGHGWVDYVAGVAAVLIADGVPVVGADLWIESDVPIGGGLSSSAALEVSITRAFLALADQTADGLRVARWAQMAENDFVGMPCGLMDQFASASGVDGAALLLDCASQTAKTVRLPPTASFLVIDSLVRHSHVDGGYRSRREDCEEAARVLGLTRLGELEIGDLPGALARLTPRVARRCRHVITETDRVRQASVALEQADLATLGRLLNQSHASLRDDMEVSVEAVDRLVDIVRAAPGVRGARMMGGGFGGCVIALVEAGEAAKARDEAQRRYADLAGATPEAFICRAVGGAGEITA